MFKQPEPEPEPEPYSASGSGSGSAPQSFALEKGKKDTYTRVGSTMPFSIPANIVEGRNILRSRGVPQSDLERCLRMLMDGHLSPYDIEEWDIHARGAA
jgi:hypothetical protein